MDEPALRDDRPHVSVIVPCYKVEAYLPACLDSLLGQTLSSLEVIAINDGSPDRCLEILQEYQKRDARLRIIDKPNEGVWRGRLDAIALAEGRYIGFLDSDDVAAPDFCEKLLATAEAQDADLVVGGFQRVRGSEVLSQELTGRRLAFAPQKDPTPLLELNGAPWNKLFKAELLKDLPSLSVTPHVFDDLILQLLVYPRVQKVAFAPYPLVYYQVRGDSIMPSIDQSKVLEVCTAMEAVRAVYQEEASSLMLSFLDVAVFFHLAVSLMYQIERNSEGLGDELLSGMREYLDAAFPRWDDTALLNFGAALRRGRSLLAIYGARVLFKYHLLGPALHRMGAAAAAGHSPVQW